MAKVSFIRLWRTGSPGPPVGPADRDDEDVAGKYSPCRLITLRKSQEERNSTCDVGHLVSGSMTAPAAPGPASCLNVQLKASLESLYVHAQRSTP